MSNNMFNVGGFHWWTGVVEDRMDPLFLGRCRIRVLGYHTEDKTILPTKDLPWAMPLQPITSAAITGFGQSPTGVLEGTWVVGFFADGEDMQQPIFIGTFAGIPQSSFINSLGNKGFQDPDKRYPLKKLLDEPDTDRLARNQGISETIVQEKRAKRTKKVQNAFGAGTWDQPTVPYSAKYPYNHVKHSESGHVIEIDDTPSGERLHTYHRTGTFTEIHPDGTMTRKIVGDDFLIVEQNGYVNIKGKLNITVDGSTNIYVKNNCNLEVDGNLKMHGHGDVELKAGKNLILTAKDAVKIHADENIDIDSSKKINVKGKTGLVMTGTKKTTISSPITEVATIKFNGMGITPFPPKPPSISAPSTISSKSPSEKIITRTEFTLTPEERLTKIAEKIIASDDPTPAGKEQVLLNQAELDTNEKTSVAVADDTPIEQQPACDKAQKIIAAALADVGVIETGLANGFPKDYGGIVGGGELPPGQAGRIDQMLSNTGLNNQDKVKKDKNGRGYYWCAAAVTTWWKEAGLPTPTGSASCRNWGTWARSNGTYSTTPTLGAAVLYGAQGAECHIGIVAEIQDDGTVISIEGNTSGGPKFDRGGCGCFKKKVNKNWAGGVAYVAIPDSKCPKVPPAPTEEDIEPGDLKTFIENIKGTIPEDVRQQLPEVAEKFGIDTPLRMSHFLAQCSHESGNFTRTTENLNYSASSLRAVFPRYVTSDEQARQYERNPTRIANLVYANRLGNGTEESGDGYKYRGRGYIQLTGKANYQAFARFVPEDIVANPDLVASKYPLLSAAWFWKYGKGTSINSRADTGETAQAVTLVTQAVNGGTNGLADRQAKFNTYIAFA